MSVTFSCVPTAVEGRSMVGGMEVEGLSDWGGGMTTSGCEDVGGHGRSRCESGGGGGGGGGGGLLFVTAFFAKLFLIEISFPLEYFSVTVSPPSTRG